IEDKRSIVDVYTNAIFEITGSKSDIDTLETLFNQEEIIERKEKKGKISERNLGERVKDFSRVDDTINLELVNTSPNSFLILAGVDIKDVHIIKKGYKI
ncbi:MAG: TIGR03936 family radical SAM-associated protein, partial [Cetobacterium sp.]